MPRPLRTRRAARTLLAPLLAALPVALVPAGALAAVPTPAPTAASPVTSDRVQVVVTELPRAPSPAPPGGPAQPFVVTGTLVNRSSAPVSDLAVRLLVGDGLRTRSALALAAATPSRGRQRGPDVPADDAVLAPGATTTFTLRTTVPALALGRIGVYPVQVVARGRAGDGARTADLGTASTFVPWFPDGAPAPSRLVFVWPLVDAPARAPDGTLLGTGLDAELAPATAGTAAGRLAALLDAVRTGAAGACDPSTGASPPDPGCRHDPVPVTLAVDPALLETTATLAGPHTVLEAAGPHAVAPSADAQRWLSGVRGLAGGDRTGTTLLALPYADPDVAALAPERSGLADDLDQLRLLGRRVVTDLVGAAPADDVAWPPPGRLSSAALDATVGGGATAVVLDSSAVASTGPDVGRTPGARVQLSSPAVGRVTGLVADPELSTLLTAGPADDDWQGPRLAEQRWLAETAMIAAERPGESRTFLVAPPRRSAAGADVGTAVLRDAGRLPWLCGVPLAAAAAGTDRCPDDVPDTAPADPARRGDLATVGSTGASNELPGDLLAAVAATRALGTQLTDEVLVAGSDAAAQVKSRFLAARARSLSSAWRDRPEDGRRIARLYAADVDAYRRQVRITTSGSSLLTSSSGVIDVSISNALDQPVTVGVALNDPVQARLASDDTAVRTIAPSEVVPVRVSVHTRTSGQFVVRATLLDRAGQRFGEPAELVVRSTGYGRLALAITGVGAGVLLVAAGVRIVRRATRRAAPVGPEDAP